jgi:hypothetical protein
MVIAFLTTLGEFIQLDMSRILRRARLIGAALAGTFSIPSKRLRSRGEL